MKGVTRPLTAALPQTVVVFTTNEYLNGKFKTEFPKLDQNFIKLMSGALAGSLRLAISVPTELLKCREQISASDHRNSVK